MKRFSIIFSWLISVSIALSAAPRTVTDAMELAQTFLAEQVQQGKKAPQSHAGGVSSTQELTLSHTQMLRDNSTPAVYVFNSEEGFVWVSADDNAKPVLGYSDAGVFNPSDIPANVRFWLDMYAHEIERAAAQPRRKAKASATYTPVSPLCSATWNQGHPYNSLCPQKDGERTVTGCVATAAAQVMYANRYPTQGTGSHSYLWNGQTLSADFGSTTYAWNDMLNNYSGNTPDGTPKGAQIWPIWLDGTTFAANANKVVADFRPDYINNNLYIWGDTYTAGAGTGLNFYDNPEGYFSLVVGSQGWSGGGFNLGNASSAAAAEQLRKDIVSDPGSYYLHIAIKSTTAGNHRFYMFNDEATSFVIGTGTAEQGIVIGDFTRDGSWAEFDIPMSMFANTLSSLTFPTEGNFFCFLSGGQVNTQLDLDAVYFYKTQTPQQEQAVANLMYHCGVACEMEYDISANGGSGANTSRMAAALVTYFGYDAGIQALPKDYMDQEEMLRQMASDLTQGHTILMSGRTKNDEGHAFVCDGIRSDGYLHINWGWGGSCDGYYALSALDPAEQGIGGASSGYAFTENVTAFTNIKPDAGGKERVTITATDILWVSDSTQSKFSPVYFEIDDLTNAGICTMNGYYAFNIYKDGAVYSHKTSNATNELPAGYYFTSSQTTSVDLSSLPDGDYELSVGVSQSETYYPFLVASAGEKKFAFNITDGIITYNTGSPTTEITIRMRKSADCTMNTANGLWIWWWNGTGSGCIPTTYANGWYTATVSTDNLPIGCLAVNQDVTGNNWSGATQSSDYIDITSDICLEIGAIGAQYASLTAIDCNSGEPEVVRPSFDFTQMEIWEFNSAGLGYDNMMMIAIRTDGYRTMGDDAVYGTELYLQPLAKSMTSIIGTWVVNWGTQDIGGIDYANITYGNGNTNTINIYSGYITIALDANGDYAVSYNLKDEDGNVYTDVNRTISVANTNSYRASDGQLYALQNECVTAALSASKIRTMTENLPDQNQTEMSYFAKGIIDNMVNTPEQLVQYGTGRFYISDDGSNTGHFYCFNTKWLGNTAFTTETSTIPQVGDTVIAFGPVQNYQGTTPEMKYGYVYEYHPQAEPLYSAPVNLQATTTNGYEWTFTWESGDKPAPQYLVEVLYGSNTYHASYPPANSTTVTLTLSGAHTWRVSAVDEAQNVVATTTYPDTIYSYNVPDWNVKNLQITTSDMTMSATWESPAKVFQAIIFDASGNEQTRDIINSKSYQWTAGTAGTYELYVRPVNDEITYYIGTWVSKDFTFYTEDPKQYNPYNLQATPSYGALHLQWESAKGSSFKVRLSWEEDGMPYEQTFPTDSLFLDINVSELGNITFNWSVATCDEAGNLQSEWVAGPPFVMPENPYQVQNLRATTENGYDYIFTWEYRELRAAQYQIIVYDENGNFYFRGETSNTNFTYRFTQRGVYTWNIYAYDANGNGLGFANGAAFEVTEDAPYQLQYLQATTENGYEWTFTWEESKPEASDYKISIYDANGEEYVSKIITETTYHRRFTEAGTYTWTVVALDNHWDTLYSASGNAFEVTSAVPYPLQNLQATTTNGYDYTFTWEDSERSAMGYAIYIYDANGDFYTGYTFTSTDMTYTQRFAEAGTYTWMLYALDSHWDVIGSTNGNAFEVTSVEPYPLQNMQATTENGYDYTFTWEDAGQDGTIYEILIYDANGNLYTRDETTDTTYDYHFAQAGTYIWKIRVRDDNWDIIGAAYGNPFAVTLPTYTITTTVPDGCDMDFSQGIWYYWWNREVGHGAVEATRNEAGKYVATIETDAPYIYCLVANANPLTEGWGNLQQTYDAPHKIYGDVCLTIGIRDNSYYNRWYLDERPCDENTEDYMPTNLQVTTGVGSANFTWEATEYELFEVLQNKADAPEAVSQYIVENKWLGLVFNDGAIGQWQWRVRALSSGYAPLTAFVEGPQFEIKENPYQPYDLRATTQDSATWYLSWRADVAAPQYYVTAGDHVAQLVTTCPIEVTFDVAGDYDWQVIPCDENSNALGFAYGPVIHVPSHAATDYSIRDLQAVTNGNAVTVSWTSDAERFMVDLWTDGVGWQSYGTTSNHYFQWTDLSAGNYKADIKPVDAGGNSLGVWTNVPFTIDEDPQPMPQYEITISAGLVGGFVNSEEINGTYPAGTVLTLVATPKEGYRFVKWTDGNTEQIRTLVLVEDTYLTAVFEMIPQTRTYTLTVNTAEGGTTNPSGTATYDEGKQVAVVAHAEAGYTFTKWNLVNGQESTDNPLFLTIDRDMVITPVFTKDEPKPTYTLTIQTAGNGSVIRTPDKDRYEKAEIVRLEAMADAGWHFAGWSDGDKGAVRQITITSDMMLTATFVNDQEKVYYTLDVQTTGQGEVVVNPDLAQYEEWTMVTLTAVPKQGWQFKYWEDYSTNATRYITMTRNTEVTAFFEEIPVETYTLMMKSAEGGETTPAEGTHMYNADAQVVLTATAQPGYTFTKWLFGDGTEQTANPYTLYITENTEVTPVFTKDAPQPTYTLTTSVNGQGEITVSPQQERYPANTEVTLTAVPAQGWQFVKWEDNTTSAIRTITMTRDMAVVATFEELTDYRIQNLNISVTTSSATATWSSEAPFFEVVITGKNDALQAADTIAAKTFTFKKGKSGQTYTISVRPMDSDQATYLDNAVTKNFTLERLYNVYITAGAGGKVNDEEVNGDYPYGEQITITATANEGYRFKQWSDGNGDAVRKITITEDVMLEATFQRIPSYTVTIYATPGGTTNPVADSYSLREGEDMSIEAVPDEGYIFTQWSVNGEIITENPFVITAIATDYNVEPFFTKEETGMEHPMLEPTSEKFIQDGHLYIRRGDLIYDAQGHLTTL